MPAPRAESPSLRGLATAAGIAAAPGVASAGDEYLNYNMTGTLPCMLLVSHRCLPNTLSLCSFFRDIIAEPVVEALSSMFFPLVG